MRRINDAIFLNPSVILLALATLFLMATLFFTTRPSSVHAAPVCTTTHTWHAEATPDPVCEAALHPPALQTVGWLRQALP